MISKLFRQQTVKCIQGCFQQQKKDSSIFKVQRQVSFLKNLQEKQKNQDQDLQKTVQNLEQNQSIDNKERKEKDDIIQQNLQELLQNQEEEQKKYEKEVQIMHDKHKQLSANLEKELDIPFKLYGWLNMPETTTAYMGERVFAQNRIPKHKVLDHLYKIFTGTLYSLAEEDSEFLSEYCEKNFSEKLLKSVKQLKEKGYRFKVVEDVGGIGGEPISKFYYINDMVLVRGLDVDRDQNVAYDQYHEYIDSDDMGIVIYTPNHLSQPEAFVNPKTNETIYDDYRKVVFRVLVSIRTPLRIQVFKPENQNSSEATQEYEDVNEVLKQIEIEDELYTWEHLAVFETQMKAPEKFKSFSKSENYMEWLGKFNFSTWKLVDLDNWMLGNPLITKGSKRAKYDDPIFKGSKFDPKETISLKTVY